MASFGGTLSGKFPFRRVSTHGLAPTCEDLVRVSGRTVRTGYATAYPSLPSLLPWDLLPLQRSQLKEFTSRRVLADSPRRGVPCPLRSVFVVFRDLDGLPRPQTGDLFQPLTLMGFGFPAPRGPPLPVIPKNRLLGRGGWAYIPKGSLRRSVRPKTSGPAPAPLCVSLPVRPPPGRSVVRCKQLPPSRSIAR